MEIDVSFSIFTDPVSAWGNASGKVNVSRTPKEPSEVSLPDLPRELLAHPVEVDFIHETAEGVTIVMFNVFAKDAIAAREIGAWLEREWDLFADAYGEE